jgi:hypothetical protein
MTDARKTRASQGKKTIDVQKLADILNDCIQEGVVNEDRLIRYLEVEMPGFREAFGS